MEQREPNGISFQASETNVCGEPKSIVHLKPCTHSQMLCCYRVGWTKYFHSLQVRVLRGRMLYIDLDTVITASLAPVLSYVCMIMMTPCFDVLFCFALSWSALFYAFLFFVVLCCCVLCCAALLCTAFLLWYVLVVLCCSALLIYVVCVVLCRRSCVVLCCSVFYCVVMFCTVLFCVVLCCSVLCVTLQQQSVTSLTCHELFWGDGHDSIENNTRMAAVKRITA